MRKNETKEPRRELKNLLSGTRDRPLMERFPIQVDGVALSASSVIEMLAPFLTESRRTGIADVVGGRTYSVVPVVEGLINVGNVSAVMRSAEALGYQELQVVTTGENRFKQSERTSKGAEKWMDLRRMPDAATCVENLHRRGYRVAAMHLSDEAIPIEQIDFTEKTALVFGNEAKGVSDDMLHLADQHCIVPLHGFTESFNVSVAAAVALYHAQQDRIRRQGHHADLSAEEREALTADFYLRSIGNRSEVILRRLVREEG